MAERNSKPMTNAERAKRYRDRRRRKQRVVEVVIGESDFGDLMDLYPFLRGNLSDPKVAELLGDLLYVGAVLRHVWRGRQVEVANLEVP